MPDTAKEQGQTTEKPVSAVPVLTDELFHDLKENPTKLHDQSREIKEGVRRRLFESPDQSAADTPPDSKKPEAEKTEPPAEEKLPTPEEVEAKRIELKKLSDDANKLEQKLKAARERDARAKTAAEEWAKAHPEKKVEDPLEEKHQLELLATVRELAQKVEFLQGVVADRDKEEIDALTRTKAETEETRLAKEIETLQADPKFAAIRTKKSVSVLNQEYAGWCDNLVQLSGLSEDQLTAEEKVNPLQALRQKALDKYETDPAFKSSVKVSPPEELDKLKFILRGIHAKGTKGGSLKANLFEILDDEGVLGAVVQRGREDAARESANKTVAALQKKHEEIQTIDPNDGKPPSPAGDELTPESAATFMAYYRKKQDENPRSITKEDKAKLVKVAEFAATMGRKR